MKKLSNFPKKAIPFFDGYKFDNKYFSVNYRVSLSSLHNEYPKSQGKDLYALKMQVFSTAFSQDMFSRDVIRVHEAVLRILQINLKMLPIGFHLYFDIHERCVKSTFYLLNFNKLSDEASLKNELNKDLFDTIQQKVKERVCAHYSFTFHRKDLSSLAEAEITQPSAFKEMEKTPEVDIAVFELVSLFGDQEYRKAMIRALRGLPLSKAQKLTSAMNALIKHNGDKSIDDLTVPSRGKAGKKNEEVQYTDKRLSENLLESLGLYDI
ncbi:hypothetical protein [Photobacterium galatheae]|uniref:hypothetical protein n=1 Tax=Photobacterium galatheae TaxID=1654360 RepID=UPI001268C3BA|nr:hypothetical protein [Photobacterium galatheae]MCM0149135.1 hypothetical protein [Photobacterium galatheae]